MPIVGGLDIHRKQLTFDYLDTATGEVKRGQITPADRAKLRAWLKRFAGIPGVVFAVEACTSAGTGRETFILGGIEHHGGGRTAVLDDGGADGEMRPALHEGDRTVDGIDHEHACGAKPFWIVHAFL